MPSYRCFSLGCQLVEGRITVFIVAIRSESQSKTLSTHNWLLAKSLKRLRFFASRGKSSISQPKKGTTKPPLQHGNPRAEAYKPWHAAHGKTTNQEIQPRLSRGDPLPVSWGGEGEAHTGSGGQKERPRSQQHGYASMGIGGHTVMSPGRTPQLYPWHDTNTTTD